MNLGEQEIQVSQILYEATISRKPDFLLGVELKDYLKGDNGSRSNELAFTLLEQTFQGTIPNPQILSYLKYSIRSQLITCSGVFSALTSFKKIPQQINSPTVLNCLLLIVRNMLTELISNKCDDNVNVLSKSLITLSIWSVNSLHTIIQQVNEQPDLWNHQSQNVVLISSILKLICNENKIICLLYIAAISDEPYWTQLTEEFNNLCTIYKLLQQIAPLIAFSLKEIEDTILAHPQARLKRLLSKDMDDTFDTNQSFTLEVLLSHENSPLYVNSTSEACYNIIYDIKSCLCLTDEEAIQVLIQVGIEAVNHMTQRARWAAIMYIKIPQILRLFQCQNLYSVLDQYFVSREVHINQKTQLKLCVEGFVESLITHELISPNQGQTLPIKNTQKGLFHEIFAASQYLDKMLRPNEKIITLFEKHHFVDPSLVIYIAGAVGKINHLTMVLLSAVQQDLTKDALFGNAFLIILKMVHIYGKRAVFKDINSQNFQLASWFDNFFPENHFSKDQIVNDNDVSMNDVDILLQKLFDPPKKGNDHCGNPYFVLKTAPKMIEILLKAKVMNQSIDDERLMIALMTLRDTSRAGFMAAYMQLVQMSLTGDSLLQKQAQYCLIIYQQPKYKSKLTQFFLTLNCEDLLRDTFSVDHDFVFTDESIKGKFSEMSVDIYNPKEEIGDILIEMLINQSTNQAVLKKLSLLAYTTGIEMFARILSNFIYHQRRRDLTDLACDIAIGLSTIDWIGVPLAVIWYQLPEVLSTAECSTTAEPFSRFVATQLHLVIIYEKHKNSTMMSHGSSAFQMFHNTAGNERRYLQNRNTELCQMLSCDPNPNWKAINPIRQIPLEGGMESLASFKQQGNDQLDQSYFTRCFTSLGRSMFIALSESGQSIPVDFSLSLLDQIVKKGLNQQNNSIGNIIQYFPWALLNQLLQIAGVESRMPAVLVASIDSQVPILRTKISSMIALAEKRLLF